MWLLPCFGQTALAHVAADPPTRRFDGTSLYLGIAHTADVGMDRKAVLADTTAATLHMRSMLTLQRYFEYNPHHGLQYRGKDSESKEMRR